MFKLEFEVGFSDDFSFYFVLFNCKINFYILRYQLFYKY